MSKHPAQTNQPLHAPWSSSRRRTHLHLPPTVATSLHTLDEVLTKMTNDVDGAIGMFVSAKATSILADSNNQAASLSLIVVLHRKTVTPSLQSLRLTPDFVRAAHLCLLVDLASTTCDQLTPRERSQLIPDACLARLMVEVVGKWWGTMSQEHKNRLRNLQVDQDLMNAFKSSGKSKRSERTLVPLYISFVSGVPQTSVHYISAHECKNGQTTIPAESTLIKGLALY